MKNYAVEPIGYVTADELDTSIDIYYYETEAEARKEYEKAISRAETENNAIKNLFGYRYTKSYKGPLNGVILHERIREGFDPDHEGFDFMGDFVTVEEYNPFTEREQEAQEGADD